MKDDSPIQKNVKAVISVDAVNLNTDTSGFLTIGKPDVDFNFVYWDRKWCVLEGSKFYVYNYPQEREMGKTPELIVDLQFSIEPFTHGRKCPRRKSLILKMRRRTVDRDTHFISLRHTDNFGSKKYLLAADNHQDSEKWTEELHFVMDSLAKWNKLICVEN